MDRVDVFNKLVEEYQKKYMDLKKYPSEVIKTLRFGQTVTVQNSTREHTIFSLKLSNGLHNVTVHLAPAGSYTDNDIFYINELKEYKDKYDNMKKELKDIEDKTLKLEEEILKDVKKIMHDTIIGDKIEYNDDSGIIMFIGKDQNDYKIIYERKDTSCNVIKNFDILNIKKAGVLYAG